MNIAVLKRLDVCICSTKKMKSKTDKVYMTFKCHFKMLSIKGISIFKIDAISIQRCLPLRIKTWYSLIKHITYFLFRFVYKNWDTENRKRCNLIFSIFYIILYRHCQNLQAWFLSYFSFIVNLKNTLVKLFRNIHN